MIVGRKSNIPRSDSSLSLIDTMQMMVPLNLFKVIQQIVKINFTLALNGLRVIAENGNCYLLDIVN